MAFTVAGVGVPPTILEGIQRYVQLHEPQGSFLMACFANDFHRAVSHADDYNFPALRTIAAFIHWETPAECHGSPEKVKAWTAYRIAEQTDIEEVSLRH